MPLISTILCLQNLCLISSKNCNVMCTNVFSRSYNEILEMQNLITLAERRQNLFENFTTKGAKNDIFKENGFRQNLLSIRRSVSNEYT